MHPAAYRITVNHGNQIAQGSGTAIAADLVVTAAHVTRGRPDLIRVWQPGWQRSIRASVLAVDDESVSSHSERDVAILKLSQPVDHWVPVADAPSNSATAYGFTSGPLSGRVVDEGERMTFHRGVRSGDSGGGLIVHLKGAEVLVGLISSSGGGRTYGPGINPIRRLLNRCRRRPEPPIILPPPPTDPVPIDPLPSDMKATAESAPHTESASVQWIPADRRLHFRIPRGAPGASVTGADTKRIDELEVEVAELRKKLESFHVRVPIRVTPETRP